jgi:hypothetical protein
MIPTRPQFAPQLIALLVARAPAVQQVCLKGCDAGGRLWQNAAWQRFCVRIARNGAPMEMQVPRDPVDAPAVLVQGLDLAELVLAELGRSIDMSVGKGGWRYGR